MACRLPGVSQFLDGVSAAGDRLPLHQERDWNPRAPLHTAFRDHGFSSSSASPSPATPDSEFFVATRFAPSHSRQSSVSMAESNSSRATLKGPSGRKASKRHGTTRVQDSDGVTKAQNPKAEKEQRNRASQATCFQNLEDILEIMLDFKDLHSNHAVLRSKDQQSPGNSHAAGMEFNKIRVAESTVALLSTLLEDRLKIVVPQGRLDEWRRELRDKVLKMLPNEDANEHQDLMTRTWLSANDGDEPCDRDFGDDPANPDKRLKACKVHGDITAETYIQCRKRRRSDAFNQHVAACKNRPAARHSVGLRRTIGKTEGWISSPL